MKYRQKPIEVDAVQFLGGNLSTHAVEKFMGVKELFCNMNGTGECQELIIPTLHGDIVAHKGDYIVKGVKGSFYLVNPENFNITHQVNNNQNNPQDNVPQGEGVAISNEAITKVFSFIKSIGAHIVYTDPYDYSAGIEGAEVDYLPETIEELSYELGTVICDQSRIAELEARNNELTEALEGALYVALAYDIGKYKRIIDKAKQSLKTKPSL